MPNERGRGRSAVDEAERFDEADPPRGRMIHRVVEDPPFTVCGASVQI